MAKILIFGTASVPGVPEEVVEWLRTYLSQGHEFIIGDKKGLDCAIQKTLVSIGAMDSTTIYCMDNPNNNLYDIKIKSFKTYYEPEIKRVTIMEDCEDSVPFVIEDVEKEMDIIVNRQWYEFRDRQLIEDCSMAICLYSDETKTVNHMIQLLNIKDKPCYCIKMI